jgi:hypothetical protein
MNEERTGKCLRHILAIYDIDILIRFHNHHNINIDVLRRGNNFLMSYT